MNLLIDGQKVRFTPCELSVFAELYNARGALCSEDQLLTAVYGRYFGEPDSMKIFLWGIRAELKKTYFHIHNHYGRGWWMTRLPIQKHAEVIQAAA